ncbi:MAG: DUF6090 family protein [Cyclobacteriaceae bacterium]
MSKKQKNRIDWLNHLFGLVAVVFGVLIAFWLNNWSEENKSEATLRIALENIKSEIGRNSTNLDTIIQSNKTLHSFLSKYLEVVNEEMKVTASDSVWSELVRQYPQYLNEGAKGVKLDLDLFQLSDVAWSTAHRTEAFSSLDYNLAFFLEETYTLQEKLTDFDESLIEDLKAIDNSKASFRRLHRTLGFAIRIGSNLQEKDYFNLKNAIDNYFKK